MINVPWIVPTVDGPMSSYTAMAITFIVIIGAIVVIVGYNWMKREFGNIRDTISKHDGFVEQTSEDVGTMKTDIAVLLEKCGRSQEDISLIKETMSDMQRTLLEMSKK
jgi:hypothetical protein